MYQIFKFSKHFMHPLTCFDNMYVVKVDNSCSRLCSRATSNESILREMQQALQNYSRQSDHQRIYIPSIFSYLPHLVGNDGSVQPAYKISRNRIGGNLIRPCTKASCLSTSSKKTTTHPHLFLPLALQPMNPDVEAVA